jgi:hypothetical protein
VIDIDEAKRALALRRRELKMAALRLGAVSNNRGRRPPPNLAEIEHSHENAARAFVAAEADLRIIEAGTEES